MRSFTQQQKASSARAGNSLRTFVRPSPGTHSSHHLQHTNEKQAGLRMPHAYREDREDHLLTRTSPSIAHDFSQIAVHARIPAGMQPKLKTNRTEDQYEQEADHVANQVMRMPNHSPTQRTPRPTRGTVQPHPRHIPFIGSPGVPLPSSVRTFMEPRFQQDFSGVRIHTDAAAAQQAAALPARAFTIGNQVAFGESQYAPNTRSGLRLIAHELAHVVQNVAHPPGAEHVIRCSPPEEKQEFKWEDDYYYDTEEKAQQRVEKLKRTWSDARYREIKVSGETKWQVQKRGPKKPEPSKDKTKSETKKKDEGWTPDTSKFEKREDAEKRKKVLEAEDEWTEFRVAEVKEAKKTFYRVEMRGKLKPGTAEFALTFDDGPHSAALGKGANRTEKVLDALTAEGIKGKGAFFVQTHAPYRGSTTIGKTLIKRMFDEGYTVGIHTGGKKDHEAHTAAQKAGRLEGELTKAKKHLKDIGGSDPDLVRAPYGKTNAEVHKVYKKLKLKHLHWDIDGDPGGSHPLATLKRFFDAGLAALERGAKGTFHPKTGVSSRIVVLYHDIRKGTADNIGAMIKYIKKRVPKATFKKP